MSPSETLPSITPRYPKNPLINQKIEFNCAMSKMMSKSQKRCVCKKKSQFIAIKPFPTSDPEIR